MASTPKTQGYLSRRTLWGVGLRFTGLTLQLVTGVVAARLMGPQEFGAYVLAHTFVLLVGGAAHWGQGDLALRLLPKASRQVTRHLLHNCALAVFCTSALVATLLWGAEILGIRLAPGWDLVGALLAVHGLCLTLAALLAACDRVLWVQIIDAVLRPAAMLAFFSAAILAGNPLDAAFLFQCSIGAAATSAALLGLGLGTAWARRTPIADTTPNPKMTDGFPLLATGWSSLLLSQLDHLVVGLILGDSALGVYRVASRAAGLVGLVQQVATQVLGPRLARAMAKQDPETARGLAALSAWTAIAGGCVVATIIAGLTHPYLQFLGPDFAQALYLIPALTLAQIAALPFGAGALFLILIEKEAQLFWVNAITATVGAIVLMVAAYLTGPVGVAIAMAMLLPAYKAWLRQVVLKAGGPDPAITLPSRTLTSSERRMRPKGS